MKEIVSQSIEHFFKKMQKANISEIQVNDASLLEQKWSVFVTLYINGEVHGSAGNIKEIENSLAEEAIASSYEALTQDKRFKPLTKDESEKIQFRVDTITDRKIINQKDILSLDPVKQWLIAIMREYDSGAVILPNMSPKLLTGEDLIPVMQAKLWAKKIDDKNCIFYSIETKSETNY